MFLQDPEDPTQESWLSHANTPGAAEMVGPEIVHARWGEG